MRGFWKTLLSALGLLACATPAAAQLDITFRDFNPATQPGVHDWPAPFEFRTFKGPHGDLPYRLLVPAPTAELPPLIIMLHGSGMAMGTDNAIHMGPFISQWGNPEISAAFPAYVACPQVATRSVNYFPSSDGLPATTPGPSFDELIALAEHLVRTLPVDKRRVYLIGFSMGGSTTLMALQARPDLFAAGVAFSANGPDRSLAAGAKDMPVMLVHGDQDPDNRIEPDRAWADALVAAGGHPKMIVYRGMDHRVPTDMVAGSGPNADWRTWLFSQAKTAAAGR